MGRTTSYFVNGIQYTDISSMARSHPIEESDLTIILNFQVPLLGGAANLMNTFLEVSRSRT
jgi:hypothetical protein